MIEILGALEAKGYELIGSIATLNPGSEAESNREFRPSSRMADRQRTLCSLVGSSECRRRR